jgi:adenylate cyclase
MLINWCGRRFPYVSIAQIIDGKHKVDAFKDKIVLVFHGADIKEFFSVPRGWNGREGTIPGGEIHANAINTIITGTFIRRLGDWHIWLLGFALIVLSAFLLTKLPYSKALLILIPAALVFWLTSISLLKSKGLYIDAVSPLLLLASQLGLSILYESRRVRKIFMQFVPKSLAERIFSSEKDLALGGKDVEATVLFSDIRGYTTLSEKISPEEVMNLLNRYHSTMGRVFRRHGGVVFDYQGDAQMVVFGAPDPSPDHAKSAVKTAIEMQREMAELRKELGELGAALEVGIGVATGTIAYGMVGDEHHKDFAAIGDTVNVAARLQALSRDLGSPITITEQTFEKVKNSFVTEKLPPTKVKGKSEPLVIYRVPDQDF